MHRARHVATEQAGTGVCSAQVRRVWLEGVFANGALDEHSYQNKLKRVDQPIFPGSQPVSLSYANESLLYQKRCAAAFTSTASRTARSLSELL